MWIKISFALLSVAYLQLYLLNIESIVRDDDRALVEIKKLDKKSGVNS